MDSSASDELRFRTHSYHLIRIERTDGINAIREILVKTIVPAQIEFEALVSDLTRILHRVVGSTCRDRNRYRQEDILGILNIVIHRETQSVVQCYQVDTDIGHRSRFPLDIRIGKILRECALQELTITIRIIDTRCYSRRILIIGDFLITQLSISCSQLQLVEPLNMILDKLFLGNIPTYRHRREVSVTITFGKLRRTITAHRHSNQVSILIGIEDTTQDGSQYRMVRIAGST